MDYTRSNVAKLSNFMARRYYLLCKVGFEVYAIHGLLVYAIHGLLAEECSLHKLLIDSPVPSMQGIAIRL